MSSPAPSPLSSPSSLYVLLRYAAARAEAATFLPSFFRPADPTQTAEALGGRDGRREVGKGDKRKVARLHAFSVCLRCVFDRHCSRGAGQLKGVRAERGGGGHEREGEDKDDDDEREG